MTNRVFALVAVATLTGAGQQQPAKPKVIPMFESSHPAFVLDCENAGRRPARAGGDPISRMWIDGALWPTGVTAIIGGELPMIAPGASWREMVALHPESGGHSTGYPGLSARADRVVDIVPGRHTVSFECGGVRSDEFAFYWKDVPAR